MRLMPDGSPWQRLHPNQFPAPLAQRATPQNSEWENYRFTDFYDPFLGRMVDEELKKNGRDENILVQYDRYDAPSRLRGFRLANKGLLRFDRESLRNAGALRFDIPVSESIEAGRALTTTLRFEGDLARLVDSAVRDNVPAEVYLLVGLRFENPNLIVRVFLNARNPEQGDLDSPSFVRTIGQFVPRGHASDPDTGYVLDILPTLKSLNASSDYTSGRLDVSFLGEAQDPNIRERTTARVESLSIVARLVQR